MVAVKGVFENGKVTLAEPAPAEVRDGKRHEVTILFGAAADDDAMWESLLSDPRPRPALSKTLDDVARQVREGKAAPLNPDDL